METTIKYKTKTNKKSTYTKLISKEYAYINENNECIGTTNEDHAKEMAKKGIKVFQLNTYEIKVKQQLKP